MTDRNIIDQAIFEYINGLSSRELAKKYNVNQKTILNWVHKFSSFRRKPGAMEGVFSPNYGKPRDREIVDKIASSNLGKKRSIESRKKMSDAKKGKPVNPKLIEGSVKDHKVKPLSLEHRKKIGESNKKTWTPERIKKASEDNKGDKSSNWKGGVSPLYRRIRRSLEWREWRESVFSRDDWTCQDCGKRGGVLEPHHIKPFAEYPDDRFDIKNGITYCVDCHKKNDPRRH